MFHIWDVILNPLTIVQDGKVAPPTRHPGSMESLAQFTATAVDALAKDGFCVIQLPLSPGRPGIGDGSEEMETAV